MSLFSSKYYNSLPHPIRDSILRSGIAFDSDEEINSYVRSAGNLFATDFNFGYSYTMGFGSYWPLWPL